MADFKTVLLVLTAALGFSLIIERILELVKKLIARFLLSDNSPFRELKARPVEAVLFKVGAERISGLLDDKNEEIEEIREKIKQAAAQKKDKLEKKLVKVKGEIENLKTKLTVLIEDQLKNNKQLLKVEKDELRKKLNDLQIGRSDRTEIPEEYWETNVILDKVDPPDPGKTTRTFWLQIIGTLSGIVICYFSKFGIFHHLLENIFKELPTLDYFLTGILIGGGSQPIHTLIRFITDRKLSEMKVSTKESIRREEDGQIGIDTTSGKIEPGKKEVLPSIKIYEVDIPYSGGVDKDKLQFRHKRIKNPDLIVYHHTAMHSDSSFNDVVSVIKDRGWVTGYNCVVLKDGGIYPFCRWDRYGNHAKGYNRRSLGIAFHGNFEPDPKVSFSNVNGRLGILEPTDVQLLAASKVVALWCHLYDIPVNFSGKVIPHKNLAPKACPGSNFPHEKFHNLITNIFNQWKKSSSAKEQLQLYKQKQYIYI